MSRRPDDRPRGREAPVSALPAPLPLDALDLAPDAVRARFAEARARGRPLFPWPDLAPEEWRAALAELGRVAAAVLGGAERVELRGAARALGIAGYTSGTGPLLGHWIARGRVATDEPTARLLLLHLEHGRRRAARLQAAYLPVAVALAEAGVRPTIVKGFHTARAVFPEPGARPLSDIDLVVTGAPLRRAIGALRAAGFVARPVQSRPYVAEWRPRGEGALPSSLELTHAADPWAVDLHGSFVRDFGGAHRVAPVPDRPDVVEPFEVWGPPAAALRQPWLTAYLAAHASQELKNLQLVRLIELVWVIRAGRTSGALDWAELRAGLDGQGALRFVHPAFALAERLAPGTVDASFLAAVERAAPERVRRIVAGLEPWSAQRLEAVSLAEQLMWVDGPLSFLRRARRALWPAWAGSVPAIARVQAARLRQVVAGRVGR